MLKSIYKTHSANIILSVERMNAFPLRSQTQGCLLSPLLFSIVLEVFTRARKREGGIQIEKGSIKLSSFTDDMTAYAENSMDSTKKLLVTLAKLQDTRSIHKNQFYFSVLAMNKRKLKFKNNIIYNSIKNKKYLGINQTKGV